MEPKDFEGYRTDILKKMGKSCRNTLEHIKQTGTTTKEAVLTWGIEKVKARFNINYAKGNSQLKFDLESKNPKKLTGDDLDRWVQEKIGKLLEKFYSDRNIKVGVEDDKSLRGLFLFEKNLDEVFGEEVKAGDDSIGTGKTEIKDLDLGHENIEDKEKIVKIIDDAYRYLLSGGNYNPHNYQNVDHLIWGELKKVGILVEKQSTKKLARKVVIDGQEFTDIKKVADKILELANSDMQRFEAEKENRLYDEQAQIKKAKQIAHEEAQKRGKESRDNKFSYLEKGKKKRELAERIKSIPESTGTPASPDFSGNENVENNLKNELQNTEVTVEISNPQEKVGEAKENGYTEDMNQLSNSNLPPARSTRNREPETNRLPRGQQPLIKKFGKDAIKYGGASEMEYDAVTNKYKYKDAEDSATSDTQQVKTKTSESKNGKNSTEVIINTLNENFDKILGEVKNQNIEKSEEKVLEFVTKYFKENSSFGYKTFGFKFKEPVIWKGEEVKDFSDVVKKFTKDILVQMDNIKTVLDSAATLTHPDQLNGQDYLVNSSTKKIEGGASDDIIVQEDDKEALDEIGEYDDRMGEFYQIHDIPKEESTVPLMDTGRREKLIEDEIKRLEGGFFKKLFTGNWTLFKSKEKKDQENVEMRKEAERIVDARLRSQSQSETLASTTDGGAVETASTEETIIRAEGTESSERNEKIKSLKLKLGELTAEERLLSIFKPIQRMKLNRQIDNITSKIKKLERQQRKEKKELIKKEISDNGENKKENNNRKKIELKRLDTDLLEARTFDRENKEKIEDILNKRIEAAKQMTGVKGFWEQLKKDPKKREDVARGVIYAGGLIGISALTAAVVNPLALASLGGAGAKAYGTFWGMSLANIYAGGVAGAAAGNVSMSTDHLYKKWNGDKDQMHFFKKSLIATSLGGLIGGATAGLSDLAFSPKKGAPVGLLDYSGNGTVNSANPMPDSVDGKITVRPEIINPTPSGESVFSPVQTLSQKINNLLNSITFEIADTSGQLINGVQEVNSSQKALASMFEEIIKLEGGGRYTAESIKEAAQNFAQNAQANFADRINDLFDGAKDFGSQQNEVQVSAKELFDTVNEKITITRDNVRITNSPLELAKLKLIAR